MQGAEISAAYIPFRSADKLNHLYSYLNYPLESLTKVEGVPKYLYHKRQRRYAYAHVHGLTTWMIDVLFFEPDGTSIQFTEREARILERGERDDATDRQRDAAQRLLRNRGCIPVLVILHCNSRWGAALPMRNRTAETICQTLERCFIIQNLNVELTFISDADPAIKKAIELFNMDLARVQQQRAYVNQDDIDFVEVRHIQINMSDKSNYHTMLAPLDRFSRTLRDMIFNSFRSNPTLRLHPDTMDRVLHLVCSTYNNIPHSTLSEVMGFPITPVQMMNNLEIQQEFVRRLSGRNYNIPRDDIRVGSRVYLYQPREDMKKRRNSVEDDRYIVEEQGGRYLLRNERTGNHVMHVRSKFF